MMGIVLIFLGAEVYRSTRAMAYAGDESSILKTLPPREKSYRDLPHQ